MNDQIVSAVFDDRSEAERAVSELRSAGVADSALSVIANREHADADFGDAERHDADDKGLDMVKGALVGGGAGALLGIAALAIPGIGPLAAAGAIASTAIPEAAAIGAGAGAVTGGITKLLADHGVDEEDARYYEERIGSGGIFLSVDTRQAGMDRDRLWDILHRNGGHSASRAKTDTVVEY